MKKHLCLMIVFLMVISFTGCGAKKVESDEHFGYDTEYIAENISFPDLKLEGRTETVVLYKDKENELVRFETYYADGYPDSIMIWSYEPESIVDRFSILNEELEIFDAQTFETICDKVREGKSFDISENGVTTGFSGDTTGSMADGVYMFEISKFDQENK